MIKNILDMLLYATDETENIKIAKGKYKIPQTFKEGFKQFKNEIRWQEK